MKKKSKNYFTEYSYIIIIYVLKAIKKTFLMFAHIFVFWF